MADVLGFEVPLPSVGLSGLSGGITIFVVVILVLLIIGMVTFVIYQWRVYNRKIIVFENISGQGFQPTIRDKARLIKVGDGGEELMWLRKKKVYRTAYGKKMGKNTYWFAVGQDGYWYNIVLGDLDAKMGMLDIEPIDRDMRYMHVAVRRNITERYRKLGFAEKYGPVVAIGLFTLIMMVGTWFNLNKMSEITDKINSGVATSEELAKTNQAIVASLDNIYSGGTGVQPAPVTER